MVSAIEFRQGVTFKMDGIIYEVVQFQHVQRPRLAPLVRAKIRNYKLGTVVERTFSPDDKFDGVSLESKRLQYSYGAGDSYNFMDNESFEQYEFTKEQLGEDVVKFLKEEMEVTMQMYEGEILGIKIPNKIELKVVETPPGVKGDTVGNATKTATLETGAKVQVPLFIKEGEVIRIDTRTCEYIERVR